MLGRYSFITPKPVSASTLLLESFCWQKEYSPLISKALFQHWGKTETRQYLIIRNSTHIAKVLFCWSFFGELGAERG